MKNKKLKRIARQKRTRKKLMGTSVAPRLSVFRSNKYIYAQLIDDTKSQTLVSAKSAQTKGELNKIDVARGVGKQIAQKATKKNIKKVVFDRGGYKYHGQVMALADGAREGGLIF